MNDVCMGYEDLGNGVDSSGSDKVTVVDGVTGGDKVTANASTEVTHANKENSALILVNGGMDLDEGFVAGNHSENECGTTRYW